jgi:hypothetical protein
VPPLLEDRLRIAAVDLAITGAPRALVEAVWRARIELSGTRREIAAPGAASLRHSASGLFDQRPKFGVAVLPQLGESGIVLSGLLSFTLCFVDLRQAKVGRSPAVQEQAGNGTVSLEGFAIPLQRTEELSPDEQIVLLQVKQRAAGPLLTPPAWTDQNAALSSMAVSRQRTDTRVRARERLDPAS